MIITPSFPIVILSFDIKRKKERKIGKLVKKNKLKLVGALKNFCEAPGECNDSVYLGSLPANDSMDCLKKCQSYKGCSYGTFRPASTVNLCLLFQTCTRLETDLCPNCLTSHSLCK